MDLYEMELQTWTLRSLTAYVESAVARYEKSFADLHTCVHLLAALTRENEQHIAFLQAAQAEQIFSHEQDDV
jgi:hypothetical protein